MAITRRNAVAKEEATPPSQSKSNNEQQPQPQPQPISETASDYEQCREQRIRENHQRLQKLGILDLSLKLKSTIPSKRTPRSQSERKTPQKAPLLGPTEPRRRSSRLQNVTPVIYTEAKEGKRSKEIVLEEGAKPEFYTEEHEKLLGSTEMSWTFFVDGYRADGTRIYDPVNGKTCHQCRQKTLGLRTRCCKCNLVQGQFCGDCLYMRYGEHVVEANQNPNWVCPPCRGICNCSLCRQAKGWAPTGSLYRKINSLGFKSVAHYLIMSKRAPPNSSDKSAKKSLPFDGIVIGMEEAGNNGSVSVQEFNLDDKAAGGDKTDITTTTCGSEPHPNPNREGVGKSRKRPKTESVVDLQQQ